MSGQHPAENDVWRERPTHDVTMHGGRSTPCFCYADQNHTVGQEVRVTPPEGTPVPAENDVTAEVEREHRWFEYGRWFTGFGSSMDPHRCGEPGTVCEWRERTVTTGPWSDWTRPSPPGEPR